MHLDLNIDYDSETVEIIYDDSHSIRVTRQGNYFNFDNFDVVPDEELLLALKDVCQRLLAAYDSDSAE